MCIGIPTFHFRGVLLVCSEIPTFRVPFGITKDNARTARTSVGIFLAFFDLSFCVAVPFASVVAKSTNYSIIYVIGASSALIGGLTASKWMFCNLVVDLNLKESKK